MGKRRDKDSDEHVHALWEISEIVKNTPHLREGVLEEVTDSSESAETKLGQYARVTGVIGGSDRKVTGEMLGEFLSEAAGRLIEGESAIGDLLGDLFPTGEAKINVEIPRERRRSSKPKKVKKAGTPGKRKSSEGSLQGAIEQYYADKGLDPGERKKLVHTRSQTFRMHAEEIDFIGIDDSGPKRRYPISDRTRFTALLEYLDSQPRIHWPSVPEHFYRDGSATSGPRGRKKNGRKAPEHYLDEPIKGSTMPLVDIHKRMESEGYDVPDWGQFTIIAMDYGAGIDRESSTWVIGAADIKRLYGDSRLKRKASV